MKYLIGFVFIFLSLSAIAQFPRGLPSPSSNGYSKIGYDQADSGRVHPIRDTSWRPSKTGMSVTYPVTLVNYVWTGSWWVKENFEGVYNVKDFGAKLDGSTNDAAAIQAALNVGKKVFIPQGTAIVATQLVVKDNQIIYGVGAGSVIKASANDMNVFYATLKSHFAIRDLAIDGGGQTTNINTGIRGVIAIRLDAVQYFTLDNISIYKCGIMDAVDPTNDAVKGGFGIIVESVSGASAYGEITNCNILKIAGGGMYRGDGIYMGSQNASSAIFTHDVNVSKCAVSTVGRHCYAVASGTSSVPKYIYISDCYGDKAALCGIDVEPGENIYISNNNFQYCGNDQYFYNPAAQPDYGATYGLFAGISSTNENVNLNIIGCEISHCYYGITYGATDGLNIIGCEVQVSTISDLNQYLASAPNKLLLQDCKFLTANDIAQFHYKVTNSNSKAINCTFAFQMRTELANGFIFDKCVFKKGFVFPNPEQKLISFINCVFEDYAGAGISFSGAGQKLIYDVTVKGCSFIGTGNMTYGISFRFRDAYRWVVDDNYFQGQTTAGIFHSNAAESPLFSSCNNNRFRTCVNGIYITQGLRYSSITNNKFNDISGRCISILGIVSSEPPMSNLYLSGNKAMDTCVNGLKIEATTGAWDSCIITNNDFIRCSGTKWDATNGNHNGLTNNNLF